MSKSNDHNNSTLGNTSIKTDYSREVVIRRFSYLCELSNTANKRPFVNLLNNNVNSPKITHASLLVSANNHNTDISNRFSFFCANPTESKAFYDNANLKQWQSHLSQQQAKDRDAHTLDEHLEIPFHSGWLGYFAYPESSITDHKKPIAEFNYYSWVICFDHKERTLNLLGSPSDTAYEVFKLLQNEKRLTQLTSAQSNHAPHGVFTTEGFNPLWSKDDYAIAFERIQHYLRAGDCYQINLTQPYRAHYQGHATSLLAPLFTQMQPNFGGYFKGAGCLDDAQSGLELISLSPERFVSIDHTGRLEAKPIKGTIKRDLDGDADLLLIDELTNSSKNQAENLMIVDLLRNDLSRSAIPGSVKVDKLFELESHPNVHHLVSTISAQLKTDVSSAIAIAQAFPGGSITGAPKIRAMEIIEELEIEPRSLYCGSLGYFSDSGHCDFNILIRNLEFRDGIITCWGGGGITIDSEVNDEYEESITKIQRIMDVVESTNIS